MQDLIFWIICISLIFFAVKGIIDEYQSTKKKEQIVELLNPNPKNIGKAQSKEKKADTAFEKVIAKNNQFSYFLKRFENNHLWKIYAVITIFFIFMVVNELFKFVSLDQSVILIILLVTIIFVIIIPGKISASILNKRIRRLSNDVPMLIDMLAVMIQSGMTVENALRFVKDKFAPINPDMASVLERACLKMDVSGINSALSLIYEEVPSREIKMLCSTLQQSVNYGNSIYQILLELASEIRELQILETEEKISAASAKMTLPMMLFILFPILVIVLGPVVVKLTRMFA
ncbi:type II secretion system F family protein [Zophobihabitans entericus]|uniref:Type II secretion system F family protein n=1 Tax=Zophobihabitans entericus TaxID=1635327 RepID=A0A6G9IAR2_9GAMM|nr:type II secretion system F family protein [Zophobihabitans entericus]QIQ21316.1 type II secretion system F family protein [Zophobihabitans entericus]